MTKLIIIIAVIVVLGIIGQMDYDDAKSERATYCKMVALWNSDKARSIPPSKRAGWPPYNGECSNGR